MADWKKDHLSHEATLFQGKVSSALSTSQPSRLVCLDHDSPSRIPEALAPAFTLEASGMARAGSRLFPESPS